jgi:hypothetical protein
MSSAESGLLNSGKCIRLNSKANDCAPEHNQYQVLRLLKIDPSRGSAMCWKTAAADRSILPALNLPINKSRERDAFSYSFSTLSNIFKPRQTGVFDQRSSSAHRRMLQKIPKRKTEIDFLVTLDGSRVKQINKSAP